MVDLLAVRVLLAAIWIVQAAGELANHPHVTQKLQGCADDFGNMGNLFRIELVVDKKSQPFW